MSHAVGEQETMCRSAAEQESPKQLAHSPKLTHWAGVPPAHWLAATFRRGHRKALSHRRHAPLLERVINNLLDPCPSPFPATAALHSLTHRWMVLSSACHNSLNTPSVTSPLSPAIKSCKSS